MAYSWLSSYGSRGGSEVLTSTESTQVYLGCSLVPHPGIEVLRGAEPRWLPVQHQKSLAVRNPVGWGRHSTVKSL